MNLENLSIQLRDAVSGLHKTLRRQNNSAQTYSMTEMETIGHLMRNRQLLPSELAQLTRVKTQSMSQIIKKMESFKIVRRIPSDSDRRKVYISLTNTGKRLVEEVMDRRNEWLKNSIRERLTDKEIQQLQEALPLLQKLLTPL